MGKFKVSFTTALFVFSFLICVIVAVVFVDRTPRNDYDAFYEDTSADANTATAPGKGNSGWNPAAQAEPTPVTEPPAPVSQVEALLADLPIDTHLTGHVQPVSPTPGQQTGVNPMAGKSPEEISRALLGQSGIQAQIQSASSVPGMALPQGIATPAAPAAQATATPAAVSGRSYLPMQSNVHGVAPGTMGSGAAGLGGANPYSTAPGGLTNAAAWNPVAAQSSPGNLIGVHRAPSDGQQGMMIGAGHIESGVQPPAGFDPAPASAGTMDIPALQGSPASALPGSADKPLLLPPQPGSGMNRWDLPPAPTLPPPPIQDADNRRSETNDAPDSLNPEEASGQALAISQPLSDDSTTSDQTSAVVAAAIEATADDSDAAANDTPDPNVAAQVNDKTLTKDAAVRMARAAFRMNDKKLSKAAEAEEAEKTAEQWKQIQAAAELARLEGLSVGVSELEHYASLRADFEPAAWQLAMEEEGFSADVIRTNLESIALSEKLVENAFNDEVEEDEIRKAYDKSPSRYASPRKIRLQEIFKAKPADEDKAKRVASEMRRLQRQAVSGTDFGLLASQTSEAPTAKRGGDLGWIDPARDKDATRDKALADLEPGEVTEVLDEDDGFRIYRLTAVREAAKDFDDARPNVIAELKKPVRETTFTDVIEKYEAGELAPKSNPVVAATLKIGTPVVPTRVGSSLAGGFETDLQPDTAPKNAEQNTPGDKQTAGAATSADANAPQEDLDEEEKKFLAQELLGKAAAKRKAEERGEIYLDDTQMPQPAASTVMHQPSQQTQLLYAPGTQVQTMAGGQPAPAYQPGGMMAPHVQDTIQAPNQAVVNYGNNTPLSQRQMMQTAAEQGITPEMMQAAARPARTQVESNGWNVVKTRRDVTPPATPSAAASAPAAEQAQPIQPQAEAAPAPPGFESAGGSRQPNRGILGGVKNFFGSIGR